MKPEDYPEQEPLSAFAQGYAAELWRRSGDVSVDEFAYGPDPYQTLSIMRPARPSGPVLLFWHGGGWTSGYKEWNHFMAPAFADAGIVLVSAGYRLAPRVLFPAMLEDCVAALAWVYRHIGDQGADPARLFVGGHSAGGHLAALLAGSRHWQSNAGLPGSVIRGCLPVSGVYLFGEGSGLSTRPRFLGEPDEVVDRAASPLRQLGAPLPPFFVSWGEKDFPHLITQAHDMVAALRALGGWVQTQAIAGASHLQAHLATAEPLWSGRAIEFIEHPPA